MKTWNAACIDNQTDIDLEACFLSWPLICGSGSLFCGVIPEVMILSSFMSTHSFPVSHPSFPLLPSLGNIATPAEVAFQAMPNIRRALSFLWVLTFTPRASNHVQGPMERSYILQRLIDAFAPWTFMR